MLLRKKEKIRKESSPETSANGEKVRRRRLSQAFSTSIIVYLITGLTNAIYNAFKCGFVSNVFSAYSLEQNAYERSFLRNYFGGYENPEPYSRKIRAHFSKAFDTSFILGKLRWLAGELLATSMKLYGNFFLSFGLYSVLVYFVRELVPGLTVADGKFLLVGLISILISLPLLLSKESLARAVGKGRLTHLLFVECFGFKDEEFEIPVRRSKRKANLAILFGMILGLATFFIHPIYLPVALLGTILCVILMASPEIGVLFTIFILPFCSFFSSPSLILSLLVAVSVFSYIIKLLRGKRIFKIELLDLIVIFFMVVICMGGVITAGGRESLATAILSCILMMGFFLVVNLIRTEKWLNRCISAFVSSAVIVAAIGVLQYVLGFAEKNWIDMEYFSDIEGRVVSLFENPNVLSAYLVMAFPLLLAKAFRAESSKGKFLGFVSVVIVVTCTVLTWSRGAWLAMLISLLIFALINSRKTLSFIIVILAALPFIRVLMPDSMVKRFMSIGDIADSSTYYRIYTWRGTLSAIKDYFWGGAGYGLNTYAEIYPQYAYAGIEAAEHSHNLFLQIFFALGVFGLLIFLVLMLLFVQKNFEYLRNTHDKSIKLFVSAAFSSVCGALIVGMFDYVWYNFRLFYLFWIVFAISCAYIRFGDREAERKKIVQDIMPDRASLDI